MLSYSLTFDLYFFLFMNIFGNWTQMFFLLSINLWQPTFFCSHLVSPSTLIQKPLSNMILPVKKRGINCQQSTSLILGYPHLFTWVYCINVSMLVMPWIWRLLQAPTERNVPAGKYLLKFHRNIYWNCGEIFVETEEKCLLEPSAECEITNA